jgi:hypothetical protein
MTVMRVAVSSFLVFTKSVVNNLFCKIIYKKGLRVITP